MSVSTAPHRSSSDCEPRLIPVGSIAGQPPVAITHPVSIIGSRRSFHIRIQSRSISRCHALLICNNGEALISDLSSRAKVIVNGRPRQEAELEDGDLIKLGRFTSKCSAASSAGPPRRFFPLPAANLQLDDGTFTRISRRVMLIGRRPGADLVINSNAVSSSHAVVFEMNGRRYVRDLGSRNGTFVNDDPYRQAEIKPGDVIRVGDTNIKYIWADGERQTPQGGDAPSPTTILPLPGERTELWDAEQAPALPSEQAVLEADADEEDEADHAEEEPHEEEGHDAVSHGLPVMKTLVAPHTMSQPDSDDDDDLLSLAQDPPAVAPEQNLPEVISDPADSASQEPAILQPPQIESTSHPSAEPIDDSADNTLTEILAVALAPQDDIEADTAAVATITPSASEPQADHTSIEPAFGFLEEPRIEAFSSLDFRADDFHPADVDLPVTFSAFVGPTIGQLEESRPNAFVAMDARFGEVEAYFEEQPAIPAVFELPLLGQLEEMRATAFDSIEARSADVEPEDSRAV